MVLTLKNRFPRSRLAILGSGPSLALFRGGYDCTIAANGAAFTDSGYDFFICGDHLSPKRDWFLASQRFHATRIIANFLAPFDPIVVPEKHDRDLMRSMPLFRRKFSFINRARYFRFQPTKPASPPHCYFFYHPLSDTSLVRPVSSKFEGQTPRFYCGATIAGVALQLASYMGAAEIHMYGVDMNNFDGKTYLDPAKNRGRIQRVQVRKLAWLTKRIQATGAEVVFHRPP
ncbi:MAG: hypothetical protein AB7V40_00620 [Methyloceanibacter sp.]